VIIEEITLGIDTIPLDEQKRRRLEIEAHVESIERAKNNPFLPSIEDNPLIQTLKKLKSFFSFITALTDTKYWKWMHKQFSSFQRDDSNKEPIRTSPHMQPTSQLDVDTAFTVTAPEKKRKKKKFRII
jgi:hypothetical protein